MKTIPISKPGAGPEPTTNPSVQASKDARARAIAKLEGFRTPVAPKPVHASTPIPVDANNISPEDLSAVQPVGQSDTIVEETVQEETPQETAPVEVKAEEKQPSASSQMAILARKERAIRAKAQQQEQVFKDREAALEAREAAITAKDQEYKSGYISRDRLKEDLLGVMAEEGMSYDDLTQQLITQQQTPVNPMIKAQLAKLEAQNKALEEKLSTFEKVSVDQQTNSYKAAIKQIETDVKSLVKDDPNFEAIRATNSMSDVVDLIEQTFKKDGVLLTVEEAAQEVEDYLIEEATKLTRLEKIKKRLNASASTVQKPQSQTPVPPKQPQPMKTLTNATSSTRQLSAKERAILAFKGQLKS